ncbi:hypothetical protein BGX28_002414 [Mortierella sp. GBA30]|nr:hypothetical protein BGX28_002414 [Mortierella sp. GBA30]
MPSPHSIKSFLKGPQQTDTPSQKSASKNKDSHSENTKHDATSSKKNYTVSSIEDQDDQSLQPDKASDHTLTPGSRKRSILLNMVLPPEAPPVDAKLALPPVVLFPSALDSEGPVTITDREITPVQNSAKSTSANASSASATASSTSRSIRAWMWGGAAEAEITRRVNAGQKNSKGVSQGVVQSVNVVQSEKTTVVSKTTQIKTWITKIGRTEGNEKQSDDASNGREKHTKSETGDSVEQQQEQQVTTVDASTPGALQHGSNGEGATPATKTTTTTTTTTVQHQEIHHKTRSVALVSVNVSVSDVFGLGKVMEMILALFHAHGSFLRRQPFWLQCALLAWEGLVVLLLLWGVLRVVGLAEVIVWGADDLVRGTLSTVQLVGRTMLSYFSQ